MCKPGDVREDFFGEMFTLLVADKSDLTKIFDATLGEIINIIVSYDMGWSKRGNGRSYDSLNGYAAIIGFFSKKVLDYRTCNRKCRACDSGQSKVLHDCRKNFSGSAKAMEAHAGVQLLVESAILKEAGLQVKVVIGDEDSSLMAAVNRVYEGRIHKISDMNHIKKCLRRKLYTLQETHKELKKKGIIHHLLKCFSYAIIQNRGRSNQLATSLKNIPDHMFNKHENCGTWCKSSPKYVIKNETLFAELKDVFNMYVEHAFKLSFCGSSQANEAFNHTVTCKFPKNRNYSTSASGDFRVANAVLQTNEGEEGCVVAIKTIVGVPISTTVHSYFGKVDKKSEAKANKSKTPAQKKRRIELDQSREQLRKCTERREGVSYQSNMGIECPLPVIKKKTKLDKCNIVIFDLETSGRSANTDMILQIAAQINGFRFSVHIIPTQPIDPSASVVNGLTNIDGTLYYQGIPLLFTVSTFDALLAFYEFLNKFEGMCLLTAHKVSFDRDFLLKAIINHNLVDKFAEKVYGFSDTLSAFRKKFPERIGNGSCTLKSLAVDLLDKKNSNERFHEANYDVDILHELVDKELSLDLLVANANTFNVALTNYVKRARSKSRIHEFDPLKTAGLTSYMLNKLASSDMTYDQLAKIYQEGGEQTLKDFLAEDVNKKTRLTKKIDILDKIISHFKK